MKTRSLAPFDHKLWLSSPTMHGEELTYMQQAYETNWMSTVGENINAVEALTTQKVGCGHAVALASGTAALHLAMKLAGVRPGEKVFCSDMTFAATVNPVVYEGGLPVLIDTEYATWNMDPAALERAFALYPEVKVVVLVHLYGTPARLDEIEAICARHGALLVEDAAESLGAAYKGKMTGAFGHVAAISFNGNKIITGSSGGCLLTQNKAWADLAQKWSTQSRENAPWYQHEDLGYNYRMSNVVAGVVRGQYAHLEEHIARKKAIYQRYQQGFSGLPVDMNPLNPEGEANHWLSCLTIRPEAMCPQTRSLSEATFVPQPGKSCPTEILQALAEANAEGRPLWKPMHLQPLFSACPFVTREGLASATGEEQNAAGADALPQDVGRDLFSRGLCLPSDNKMTAQEQDQIIEIVRSCFD